MPHLLISARDPGAAAHLAMVARAATASGDWRVSVLAAPPGDAAFARLAVPHRLLHASGDALDSAVQRQLAALQPDLILTGLSGPDRGLDEALQAAAGDRPCYLFQDYWGDLNPATPPGVRLLCLDAAAVAHTRSRHQRAARAVGSPAHDGWPAPRPARRRLRHRLGQPNGETLTLLCDQPLWRQPGYALTLARAIRQLRHGRLLIRPHPRSGRNDRLRLRRLLRLARIPARWDASAALPDCIAAADRLLSVFSNCAFDAANCNARPGHPGTVAINLLGHPALRRFYRGCSGFERTPLAAAGLALDNDRQARLGADLRRAARPALRARLRGNARRQLAPAGAARALLRLLAADLAERGG